jgi:hypothetical protein
MKRVKICNEWQSEWFGGSVVEILTYTPDPKTFRNEYYVNAIDGKLYKKVEVSRLKSTWHPVTK